MVTGSIVGLDLDRDTATHYVERIKEHLVRADYHVNQARKLILDLREREGWRTLGYASWGDCVQTEFGKSSSTVYRQLNAALVELELSPNGGIGQIPERVLRPLTKRGYSSEARQAIYAVCQDLVGEGGKVTSGIVETVVDGFKDMLVSGMTQDGDGNQHPITERMEADLLARVREKKIAHKEHINRMDKKRTYLLGGVPVDKITRGQLDDGRVAAFLHIDDLQREKLREAIRDNKPVFCALWTEE